MVALIDGKTKFKSINSLDINENTSVKIWLKGIDFQVILIKQFVNTKKHGVLINIIKIKTKCEYIHQ